MFLSFAFRHFQHHVLIKKALINKSVFTKSKLNSCRDIYMVLRLICRNTNQAIKQVCDVGTVQARIQDLCVCVCVWGGGGGCVLKNRDQIFNK